MHLSARFEGFAVRASRPLVGLCALSSALLLSGGVASGQEKAGKTPPPVAKVVALSSPIDEADAGRVQNVALQLQAAALKDDRQALLVLEIPPGSSKFGAVRDLAQFLTSAQISHVRTVAWIPETVDGNNVVVALACNEIVLHPDAELGDIGRGQSVDAADASYVLDLVDRRHNPKVNAAIARAMLDPQVALLRAKIGEEPNATLKIVTSTELKQLRETTTEPITTEQVKDAGVPGSFSGSKARRLDMLVSGTAETRQDVAAIYNLPTAALRPDPTAGKTPKVAYIKIDGVIEPILEQFVIRQVDRAVASGADLIIFEIDSPGGLLLSSEELAFHIADLDEKKVRTVAYIPEQALSGAALISLGCDEIYLKPGARIGDAAPIETRNGQTFERAPEKILSVLRETLRKLAIDKGRPPAVCEAMADKDLLVYEATNNKTGRTWYLSEDELHASPDEWTKGPLVHESRKENLLTVGGARASELKIAEPPVADLDDLKHRLGVPASVKLNPVGRTWVDSLIFLLNRPIVAGALIALGIVLIYLELHFMTGLLGIMSATCFAVFFWSKFLGGTAGWLEVVLFMLGIACIGMEVFVIPGFGVFGVSGGLLIIAALIMASQTFGNFAPGTDVRQMTQTIGVLSGAIVVTVVCAVAMSRFLPHIPILGGMILAPPGAELEHGPRLRPYEESSFVTVGKQGRAASALRPAGKAEIDGEYLDVFSDGVYIEAGTPIEVVRHEGNRVIVRELT
jgi:membrane-bound serine protease (ClpP class)